jgi:hypothetical protein
LRAQSVQVVGRPGIAQRVSQRAVVYYASAPAVYYYSAPTYPAVTYAYPPCDLGWYDYGAPCPPRLPPVWWGGPPNRGFSPPPRQMGPPRTYSPPVHGSGFVPPAGGFRPGGNIGAPARSAGPAGGFRPGGSFSGPPAHMGGHGGGGGGRGPGRGR